MKDDNLDDRDGIDLLLRRANDSLLAIAESKWDLPTEVIQNQFPEWSSHESVEDPMTLQQIGKVDLEVVVEFGQTELPLEQALALRRGAVLPLDQKVGNTVDILIHGRRMAKGEILVLDGRYCVRVTELVSTPQNVEEP